MSDPLMRSLLFLPVNREKFLEKAAELDADGFVIDFEDSVPATEKAAARKCLATHAPALRGKSIWVRPNAPDTPFHDVPPSTLTIMFSRTAGRRSLRGISA